MVAGYEDHDDDDDGGGDNHDECREGHDDHARNYDVADDDDGDDGVTLECWW